MTLAARPRLAILFVALAALFLSLTGAPVQAQDGSVPDQPTGLSTEASHDRVNLTWDDPNDASITHYQVLRRDRAVHDTGEFVTIDSDTGSATTSYTDDTVEPEKRYVYRVEAVNAHGASRWSSFARATPRRLPRRSRTRLRRLRQPRHLHRNRPQHRRLRRTATGRAERTRARLMAWCAAPPVPARRSTRLTA